jgi:hypothetical protein
MSTAKKYFAMMFTFALPLYFQSSQEIQVNQPRESEPQQECQIINGQDD